eukprot:1753126-Prymnesium_polylepis.1
MCGRGGLSDVSLLLSPLECREGPAERGGVPRRAALAQLAEGVEASAGRALFDELDEGMRV